MWPRLHFVHISRRLLYYSTDVTHTPTPVVHATAESHVFSFQADSFAMFVDPFTWMNVFFWNYISADSWKMRSNKIVKRLNIQKTINITISHALHRRNQTEV